MIYDVVAGGALATSIDEIVIAVGRQGVVIADGGSGNGNLDSGIRNFEVDGALVDIVGGILDSTPHDGIFP